MRTYNIFFQDVHAFLNIRVIYLSDERYRSTTGAQERLYQAEEEQEEENQARLPKQYLD